MKFFISLLVSVVLLAGSANPAHAKKVINNFYSADDLLMPRALFVTSDSYTGDLIGEALALGVVAGSGLEAADAICQYHASNAGLEGDFIAVLSDSTTNANARLVPTVGSYRLVDSTPLAENYAHLFSTRPGRDFTPPLPPIELIARPRMNEFGEELSTMGLGPSPVWTGSWSDGRLARVGTSSGQLIVPELRTCNDWSDASAVAVGCEHGDEPPGPCGAIGQYSVADHTWLEWTVWQCNSKAHLYCAER